MDVELSLDEFETLADRTAREFRVAAGTDAASTGGSHASVPSVLLGGLGVSGMLHLGTAAAGGSAGGSADGAVRRPPPSPRAGPVATPTPSFHARCTNLLGEWAAALGRSLGLVALLNGSMGGRDGNGSLSGRETPTGAGPAGGAGGAALVSPNAMRWKRSLSTLGPDSLGSKRVTVQLECELNAWRILPTATVRILGTAGELLVDNFMLPHLWHKLTIASRISGDTTTEHCYGDNGGSPSEYQLAAFIDEVKYKVRCSHDRHDAAKTMHVVDQAYAAAGLPLRGGTTDVPQLLARIEALDAALQSPATTVHSASRRASASATPTEIGTSPFASRPAAPFFRSRTRPELLRDLNLRNLTGTTVSPPSPSSPTSGALPPRPPVPAPASSGRGTTPRPPLQRSSSVAS